MERYKPELVISLFGTNDLNEALNDLTSRTVFGFRVPEFIADFRVYRLACVVRDYVLYAPKIEDHGAWVFFDPDQRSPDGDWIENPVYLGQLELNYKDIIRSVRSFDARIVMLSYLRSKKPLRDLFERISEEMQVPYIDLYSPETDTSEFFNADGFHPNRRGHRIMAERILEGLEKKGLVPKVP